MKIVKPRTRKRSIYKQTSHFTQLLTLLFFEQRRVRVEMIRASGVHGRTHRVLGEVDPPATNSPFNDFPCPLKEENLQALHDEHTVECVNRCFLKNFFVVGLLCLLLLRELELATGVWNVVLVAFHRSSGFLPKGSMASF